MKKITNVEVKLICLEANDILTASGSVDNTGTLNWGNIGARDYYEDEE